jgi:hypothetical protein
MIWFLLLLQMLLLKLLGVPWWNDRCGSTAALPERPCASPAVHAGFGFERRVCVALGVILVDYWQNHP